MSHKASSLEFSEGVNVIVGATDSGKSAVIRALKWVLTNRPSGDSFCSSWGGDTEVHIDFDNGQVSRIRSKKDNMYLLGLHDEFKAVKTDIPDEIAVALNMNDLNLQTQFESHFLLSKSAGEVAAHFNKVAHLDKIDLGLQNINRWLRQIISVIADREQGIVSVTEAGDTVQTVHRVVFPAGALNAAPMWHPDEEDAALAQGIVKIADQPVAVLRIQVLDDMARVDDVEGLEAEIPFLREIQDVVGAARLIEIDGRQPALGTRHERLVPRPQVENVDTALREQREQLLRRPRTLPAWPRQTLGALRMPGGDFDVRDSGVCRVHFCPPPR